MIDFNLTDKHNNRFNLKRRCEIKHKSLNCLPVQGKYDNPTIKSIKLFLSVAKDLAFCWIDMVLMTVNLLIGPGKVYNYLVGSLHPHKRNHPQNKINPFPIFFLLFLFKTLKIVVGCVNSPHQPPNLPP